MTSTPPRTSTRIRTPPTPLHGAAYDNYEPYSPRRSKRSTAQSNPYSSFNSERTTPPPSTVKKARFARAPTQLSSPPSSPASPVKPLHKTPRKRPQSKVAASAQSDSDAPSASHSRLAPTTALAANIDPVTMLPTPSKTPKKRPAAAIASASRVLNFQPNHPNDVMPSPRSIKKQRVRQQPRPQHASGFELYDEDAEVNSRRGEKIEIYTDANARVPERDESEDNPFIGRRKAAGGAARPQRRAARKSAEEVEREARMKEAADRGEGMVYVFRGKKLFKPFTSPTNPDDPPTTSDADRNITPSPTTDDPSNTPEQRRLKRQAGAAAQRPLTKSKIEPRLLFPSEEQRLERERRANEVDEEAVTDIEMSVPTAKDEDGDAKAVTPVETSFATTTSTPPSTSRAAAKTSRRGKKAAISFTDSPTQLATAEAEEADDEILATAEVGNDSSNLTRKRKVRGSPFDAWQRTKPAPTTATAGSSGAGRKRAGDEMAAEESGVGGGKRTRGAG